MLRPTHPFEIKLTVLVSLQQLLPNWPSSTAMRILPISLTTIGEPRSVCRLHKTFPLLRHALPAYIPLSSAYCLATQGRTTCATTAVDGHISEGTQSLMLRPLS